MSADGSPRQDLKTQTRADYPHFLNIPTRWMDNDIYGHVNNVTYYSYFDTVINEYLISAGGLDIHGDEIIGITPETHCNFHDSLVHLGGKSVRYEIGLFKAGKETPAATGWFVHVFVDRETMKPTAMPEKIRTALEKLLAG